MRCAVRGLRRYGAEQQTDGEKTADGSSAGGWCPSASPRPSREVARMLWDAQ
jgi:hypothetical protein